MLDDWEINHELADMPKEVWDFIIEHRFFAMIIPKEYGGLEFSAYANAVVIRRSSPAAAPTPRRRSACPTRWGRPNCCCITARTNRSSVICPASPRRPRSRASR